MRPETTNNTTEIDHFQMHRPHDGASECSCGKWVGPMTTLPLSDRRSFAAHVAAQAWDEGFTRGFYDILAGQFQRDASESTAVNPYEPSTPPATSTPEEG